MKIGWGSMLAAIVTMGLARLAMMAELAGYHGSFIAVSGPGLLLIPACFYVLFENSERWHDERKGSAALVAIILLFHLVLGSGYLRARTVEQLTTCENNLRSIAVQLESYAEANGKLPEDLGQLPELPRCPGPGEDTYRKGYTIVGRGYEVVCQGENHQAAGVGPNCPRLVSEWGWEAKEAKVTPY